MNQIPAPGRNGQGHNCPYFGFAGGGAIVASPLIAASLATFCADEIGRAFGVELDRVHRAIAGEFGSRANLIDSRQAQHLAEVLLGDQPQSDQVAALMKLGAYTPRPDHVEGLGEKNPAEESDKLKGNINDIGDERP